MRCLDYFGICDFLNWFWGKRGINVGQDYFRSTTASKSFQEDSIKNPFKTPDECHSIFWAVNHHCITG